MAGRRKHPAERNGWPVTAYLAAIIALGFVVAAAGVAYAHRWNEGQAHRQAQDRMVYQAQPDSGELWAWFDTTGEPHQPGDEFRSTRR